MDRFYTSNDATLNEFYQLPKVLIHDEKYKSLTPREVLAYSILKDRHSVSLKNGWIDEQNRVYFILSDKELAEMLDTTPRTANKIKNALVDHELIYMKRQGFQKPNLIYLLKPVESVSSDRKKSSYHDTKKTSNHDRKKISNHDTKKTSNHDTKKTSNPLSNTNSSNTNFSNTNKSNNLSITEKNIASLNVPLPIQKQMILHKDRLIDDNVSIKDIEFMYQANENQIDEFAFSQILSNILTSTKGQIKNIKAVLYKSITNYYAQEKEEYTPNTEKKSKEILPSWYEDYKRQEEERKKLDFSKRRDLV